MAHACGYVCACVCVRVCVCVCVCVCVRARVFAVCVFELLTYVYARFVRLCALGYACQMSIIIVVIMMMMVGSVGWGADGQDEGDDSGRVSIQHLWLLY